MMMSPMMIFVVMGRSARVGKISVTRRIVSATLKEISMKQNTIVKNKITGEKYLHVGKPTTYIDGVAFEKVVKRITGNGAAVSRPQPEFLMRQDSLERIK